LLNIDNKSVWVYNVCIVIIREHIVKTYHFTTTITIHHWVEAETEDEAFEQIEQTDPLCGEIDYQDWDLVDVTKEENV